jgi:5-methylcytosine-specific restriction enzyme subunit McrC
MDGLCIEILPKADHSSDDKKVWQGFNRNMVSTKKLKWIMGRANVNKQNIHLLIFILNGILMKYNCLFIQGLIKQYIINNVKALKGKKLEFRAYSV